jgi:REP element-mobilizing transposase RayT
MRNTKFSTKEFYHIYNRGVDKRDIFMSPSNLKRFLFCMSVFNTEEPIGSIYLYSLRNKNKLISRASRNKKLVNFIAFCLNQNHYHFILEPLVENGVQKFMHRFSTGYTKYFNNQQKRSGSLFQSKYKAIHIDSNNYLLRCSVYVNLNYKVHKNLNKKWMDDLPISSFKEYTEKTIKPFCVKDIILGQFNNKKEYRNFCEEALPDILRKKEEEKELKYMLLE